MEDLKVCIESLHTTRVKEINHEGEEIYQVKSSLSKRVTELAQRVDFTQDEDDAMKDDAKGVRPAKISTHKWPWEFTHSKLKQALTEVSVLADVLHIVNGHRQYMKLEPVLGQSVTVPLTYQHNIKKKAVQVAADIIKRGAEPLILSSNRGEKEFYRALIELRKHWRLRRTTTVVIGDLSYHSAGSQYLSFMPFEVHKGSEECDGEALCVSVPRELRGRSEILVFLCEKPIREVGPLDPLLPLCMQNLRITHRQLPPWEQQLVEAQSTLFNNELFEQLAREAYDRKADLQCEIFTNRLNIPLTTGLWVSVLLVREYDDKREQKLPIDLPLPCWELTVALKQLLRSNHRHVSAVQPPRPANASYADSAQLRAAGSNAVSASALKKMEPNFSLYTKLIKMARHLENEKKLQEYLRELSQCCLDPRIDVIWIPWLSLTSVNIFITISARGPSTPRWRVDLVLSVDEIKLTLADRRDLVIPVDKKRLFGVLKHQIVHYSTDLITQLAVCNKWQVMYETIVPPASLASLKSGGVSAEACSIVLENPTNSKKLELLVEHEKVVVQVTPNAHSSVLVGDDGLDSREAQLQASLPTNFILGSSFGGSLVERINCLLEL